MLVMFILWAIIANSPDIVINPIIARNVLLSGLIKLRLRHMRPNR